jgi:predicted nucleic-acid-binding protein
VIGLDTNILVRYVVRDDPKQTHAATRLIETQCTAEDPGWINLVVVCELTWVLSHAYKQSRESIARILETILTSNELQVESADAVWSALRKYRRGFADMADYLIGTANAMNKASPTYTFDKRASADPDFRLLAC